MFSMNSKNKKIRNALALVLRQSNARKNMARVACGAPYPINSVNLSISIRS